MTSLSAASPEASVSRIRLGVEEMRLENHMTVLLVERPSSPDIAAGWVVGSGSADDPSTQRGLAHVLEHMMFKGSETVGTHDFTAERRLRRRAEEYRAELESLRRKKKGGGKKAAELESQLATIEEQLRELLRLGEFALLYSEAGASGLNGFTFEDFTLYFVRVPAGKLELWFWLESDRLRQPVFREFGKEKEVIRQEVRQRIDSTPTGRADDAVRQAFWGASPYGWRPLGRVGDLDAIERGDAESFFRRHYAPARLTAVVVGRFDRARASDLARRYFGRLTGPEPTSRSLPGTTAGQRELLEVPCDCPPQARVLYPTVPFRADDSYALQVLAGVLNGRTGRLYRSLVLDQGIAFAAAAGQIPYRDAGYFQFTAETKGEATPEALVAAWDRELAALSTAPVGEAELRKVKNQMIASSLRQLRRPADLARQLLVYAGLGEWRRIEDWPRRIASVSAAEVQAAAARWLVADRRLVALYRNARRAEAVP